MLKIIFLLLTTTVLFSQPTEKEQYKYFSTAIDIENATTGNLDALYQIGLVSKNVEINIGYEHFNAICFGKYTFGVGYHFPMYAYPLGYEIKTVLIPSLEPTLINRWGTEWQCRSSHYTIGANLALRWHITEEFAGELLLNSLPRTDLAARYPEINPTVPIVNSIFAKIIYKF